MSKPVVAAIILAAGGSARFGEPKQLLDWQGRPLVTHTADIAWAAGLQPTVVVLGANAEHVAPALDGRPVQLLTNYLWEKGMSTSLTLGVAALPPEVEAAILLPIDQPLITSSFLRDLVARWQETQAGIVIPTHNGNLRGSPALFSRRFFPMLANLNGDIGGRALFETYADEIVTLPLSNPGALADVDTPEAYKKLQAEAKSTGTADVFKSVRAVIADMDGVLWHGETPLPGLHEFFAFMEEADIAYTLVTNNSTRTPEQVAERLRGFGVEITTDHILNSAIATAVYLKKLSPDGGDIYLIAEGIALETELRARGFNITHGDKADYVVSGWDRNLTWQKLATATQLIYRGAGFICTNPDRSFPTETQPVPGAGGQLAALEAATGVRPTIVGKPEPILYQQAIDNMRTTPQETLVIGDRLETDILGGLRLGMKTAVVLSGITNHEILKGSPIRPDLIFDNLAVLTQAWNNANK